MKIDLKKVRVLTLITLSAFIISSCEEDEEDSGPTVVPVPVISSVSPADGYPGEEATITGTDFNAVAALNLIQIDTNDVIIASITPSSGSATSLTFTRPNVSGVGETINATIKVKNVEDSEEKISEGIAINMLPVFDIIYFSGLPKTKGGLSFDADGNLYARGQDPADVYMMTPDGEESYYGQTHWGEGEMHFGDDGYLYAAVVWGDYGIVRIPPGGGDYETWMPDMYVNNPFDFDWDSDGNMYIGTADGTIYRRLAGTDNEVELLKSTGDWGTPMRLFNDDLYWYTKNDSGSNGLYKAPVPAVGDTIAPSSVTQILASEDYEPSGLAIDGMGNVYLMVGWENSTVVRVTPEGNVEEVWELPTENPNKAVWHDNKLYIAAGNQDSSVYVIHLGAEYGTGAVPQ